MHVFYLADNPMRDNSPILIIQEKPCFVVIKVHKGSNNSMNISRLLKHNVKGKRVETFTLEVVYIQNGGDGAKALKKAIHWYDSYLTWDDNIENENI